MTREGVGAHPIIYAAAARDELGQIWSWNERNYGRQRAVRYTDLLLRHVEKLSSRPLKGRPVPGRPELRYLPIKLRSRGHGHLVVYRVATDAIQILHIFHTAQDWQGKLGGDELSS